MQMNSKFISRFCGSRPSSRQDTETSSGSGGQRSAHRLPRLPIIPSDSKTFYLHPSSSIRASIADFQHSHHGTKSSADSKLTPTMSAQRTNSSQQYLTLLLLILAARAADRLHLSRDPRYSKFRAYRKANKSL